MRFEAEIAVQPWFCDHCFQGRIILPAVESMRVLAKEAQLRFPDHDLRCMEEVLFSRFLEIPATAAALLVVVELECKADGALQARLLSRLPLPRMTRLIEHCRLLFAAHPGGDHVAKPATADAGKATSIDSRTIYRDLVPFGPAYHTLQGELTIQGASAHGMLLAPPEPQESDAALGSPFPLDGAFHAACVLGQQRVDFIPFPVGFHRRRILAPTRAGARYHTTVILTGHAQEELTFDLTIYDARGKIYEELHGLRMREVMRSG